MAVWTLGLNHRTAPIDLRERFAFASDQLVLSLQGLRRSFDTHKEVAILSTCNRTEIYCAGEQVQWRQTLKWLADTGKAQVDSLQSHIYRLEGDASARHAFRVASGLDSMVLGESQILGQFKDAVRLAADSGVLGSTLNQLFQRSFAVAKEVRTATDIGAHSISMAAATVRLASQIFENIKDAHVLFVGAGEMIELCVAHFAAKSPRSITIANRSADRADLLAAMHGGRSIALADLPKRLQEFDVVISCTASTLPLIGLGAVQRALRARKNRPMFMVDLAVPRDIEPEVKNLSGVYLYTVDDLKQVIQSGQNHRQEAVAEAEIIIDQGVHKFMAWLEQRSHVPLIQELNLQADAWRQTELSRARKRLEKGDSVDSVLESLSMGLMKKVLNGPLRELNHPSSEQRERSLVAVKQFFLND
ncbi:glutamyl-tRNA reductase [Limnohabitans sp. Jir72]|uniref:glutamyl-tRNA reductase n=1 Tax=Limnohabitans sp. Jir72 TaxID=1977909 RepID=UPI000D3C4373|nr:glutamyl-tRNA reductase [Limnohabitans sp. Jir72]PUE33921.1 glutamyl-tRNA reductase [Limnohabitans sp. Jir72]